MRDVSSSFSYSIANEQLQLTEVYTVTLADGSVYRYTNHPTALTWDAEANSYLPVPITRDPIRGGIAMEMEPTRVYMAAITPDGMIEHIQHNNLDACNVVIRRIFWSTTYDPEDEIVLFDGAADVEYNRDLLVMELKPWIDSLNIQVPQHTYQEPCNYHVYDTNCGLAQSSFSYDGVSTGGSRTTLIDTTRGLLFKIFFEDGDLTHTIKRNDTIAGGIGGGVAKVVNITYEDDGTGRLWFCELAGAQFVAGETLLSDMGASVTVFTPPSECTDLYERGELHIRSGDNSGQRRMILRDFSWTTRVFNPFPNVVDESVSYTLYPGCNGTARVCDSWFDNPEHFRGFIFVPRIEEVML